jgi:hypothetical protein
MRDAVHASISMVYDTYCCFAPSTTIMVFGFVEVVRVCPYFL